MAVHYFAGERRNFCLRMAEMVDLERLCGGVGFGEIYVLNSQGRYKIKWLSHIVRLALIGGGMSPADAQILTDDHLQNLPVMERWHLASKILLDEIEGVEPSKRGQNGDASEPLDMGAVLAAMAKQGVGPSEVLNLTYRHFVAMMQAFGGDDLEAPSEDSYMEMLKERFPEVYKDALNGG